MPLGATPGENQETERNDRTERSSTHG